MRWTAQQQENTVTTISDAPVVTLLDTIRNIIKDHNASRCIVSFAAHIAIGQNCHSTRWHSPLGLDNVLVAHGASARITKRLENTRRVKAMAASLDLSNIVCEQVMADEAIKVDEMRDVSDSHNLAMSITVEDDWSLESK